MCTRTRACVHGLCSCVRSLFPCVRRLVLESMHTWASTYVRVLSVCVRKLRLMHAHCQVESLSWPFWTPFSSVSHLIANLTLFFIIFAFEYDSSTTLHLIGNLKLSFFCSLIQITNLTSPYSIFQAISLYSGRGSTNRMAKWYGDLIETMKAHIYVASFEPIIRLLPERSMSAILVQSPIERWWDTTYTFHIVEREMTVTPRDFHHITGLRCDGATINLEGESATQLAINCSGGGTLQTRFTTSTLRWITGLFHRRRLRTMLRWLGHSCYTF